jgi:2-hydroxychromene-2-carboxylate isomerase
MAKPRLEFFFSFRSPYSYLAAPRVFDLVRRYDIEIEYVGIMPMVTRGVPLPFSKKLFILRDAAREAARLGMPFGKIYDPIGEGALRCLYIAEYAAEQGRAEDFVLMASRAIWAEGLCMLNDNNLRKICRTVGLPWYPCKDVLDSNNYQDKIESNRKRLDELGHWGVPIFQIEGEIFWGQDRIIDLEYFLTDKGYKKL